MTTNQVQENISIKLTADYLSTLLTGNVVKFPVDSTKFFTVNIYLQYMNRLPAPSAFNSIGQIAALIIAVQIS